MKLTWNNIDEFRIYGRKRFINGSIGGLYYHHDKCNNCHTVFMSKTKNAVYCSSKCANVRIIQNQKYPFSKLLSSFENEGYALHTKEDEYINQSTILKYTCRNGHNRSIRSSGWVSGQRCSYCAKNKPVSWSDIIHLFEKKKGWKVLSDEYTWKNSYSKVKFQCPNKHTHSYSYSVLKNKNYGCPYCNNSISINFHDIKKLFEDENWVVLSTKDEYVSQNTTPIHCVCPNGHKQFKHVRKWRQGRRCLYCTTSGPELELRSIVESLYKGRILYNNRSILNGKELDIYLPDEHIAIEFNGNYWHCNPCYYKSTYFHKHKKLYANEIWVSDKTKQRDCKKRGIDLIVIWEDFPKTEITNIINNRIYNQ